MTDGWLKGGGVDAFELAGAMAAAGVARIMYTDIGRDGAMTGPDIESYRRLVATVGIPVVASGGVASLDHLLALADAGCEGAVVGKALYEGALDLRAAIEAVAAC
jgi:phosphoribosylformimino-5-aminoimidazole carboxamide ribotide isomerase